MKGVVDIYCHKNRVRATAVVVNKDYVAASTNALTHHDSTMALGDGTGLTEVLRDVDIGLVLFKTGKELQAPVLDLSGPQKNGQEVIVVHWDSHHQTYVHSPGMFSQFTWTPDGMFSKELVSCGPDVAHGAAVFNGNIFSGFLHDRVGTNLMTLVDCNSIRIALTRVMREANGIPHSMICKRYHLGVKSVRATDAPPSTVVCPGLPRRIGFKVTEVNDVLVKAAGITKGCIIWAGKTSSHNQWSFFDDKTPYNEWIKEVASALRPADPEEIAVELLTSVDSTVKVIPITIPLLSTRQFTKPKSFTTRSNVPFDPLPASSKPPVELNKPPAATPAPTAKPPPAATPAPTAKPPPAALTVATVEPPVPAVEPPVPAVEPPVPAVEPPVPAVEPPVPAVEPPVPAVAIEPPAVATPLATPASGNKKKNKKK